MNNMITLTTSDGNVDIFIGQIIFIETHNGGKTNSALTFNVLKGGNPLVRFFKETLSEIKEMIENVSNSSTTVEGIDYSDRISVLGEDINKLNLKLNKIEKGLNKSKAKKD